MPRFSVKELRSFTVYYLIDAHDEDSARRLDGDIVDELDGWSSPVTASVEEVPDTVRQAG